MNDDECFKREQTWLWISRFHKYHYEGSMSFHRVLQCPGNIMSREFSPSMPTIHKLTIVGNRRRSLETFGITCCPLTACLLVMKVLDSKVTAKNVRFINWLWVKDSTFIQFAMLSLFPAALSLQAVRFSVRSRRRFSSGCFALPFRQSRCLRNQNSKRVVGRNWWRSDPGNITPQSDKWPPLSQSVALHLSYSGVFLFLIRLSVFLMWWPGQ